MAHASKAFPPVAEAVLPATKAQLGAAEPHISEGPRKLVRPRLPEQRQLAQAPRRLRGPAPLAMHESFLPHKHIRSEAAGHAEVFYFQKQIQAQTPMVFVLEDGERIAGVVEWCDRDTIKVRNSTRMLIFKRSIKYLYKAGETHS